MKVTSVDIHPDGGADPITLSFRDPGNRNAYNIKNIAGLDADEIVSQFYGSSTDGSIDYHRLAVRKRNIIVRVQVNPRMGMGETFSGLRDKLYKMIASSRTGLVKLNFKDSGEVVATISGFISKFEYPHFTRIPELQFTLNCKDGMLKTPEPVDVDISGLDPALTNLEDTVSTAPHGFKFTMGFTDSVNPFRIFGAGWQFEVSPVGGFLNGDVLHFSSEHKTKHLYIVRGSNTIHIADRIVAGSIWPIMFPGENEFECISPTSLEWQTISYYPLFWGV